MRKNLLKKTVFGMLILLVTFIIALIASAKVTLTPSGSYYKLYFFNSISMKLSYSGANDKANFSVYPFAAPIVEQHDDTSTVHYYCLDQAYSRKVSEQEVNIICQEKSYQFSWSNTSNNAVIEEDKLADNILVLSDIHGDINYLNSILMEMAIVDDNGDWQWQDNQVVITGDSVDKGPADFSVLWRLYQLSQQAELAGGRVHVLLGNHEHYQLTGNHSRLNVDMRAKTFAMTNDLAISPYGTETVLGKWLRSRPIIIRLGNYLFTHGGLSVEHLDSEYSLAQLNESVWRYYQQPSARLEGVTKYTASLDLTLGKEGLLWFRGQLREKRQNTPNEQQLAKILAKYNADTLVIGHSAMNEMTALHNGMVWPAHTEHKSGQVLLIDTGKAKKRQLKTLWYDYAMHKHSSRKSLRTLKLLADGDGDSEISVVKAMVKQMRIIQKSPRPY